MQITIIEGIEYNMYILLASQGVSINLTSDQYGILLNQASFGTSTSEVQTRHLSSIDEFTISGGSKQPREWVLPIHVQGTNDGETLEAVQKLHKVVTLLNEHGGKLYFSSNKQPVIRTFEVHGSSLNDYFDPNFEQQQFGQYVITLQTNPLGRIWEGVPFSQRLNSLAQDIPITDLVHLDGSPLELNTEGVCVLPTSGDHEITFPYFRFNLRNYKQLRLFLTRTPNPTSAILTDLKIRFTARDGSYIEWGNWHAGTPYTTKYSATNTVEYTTASHILISLYNQTTLDVDKLLPTDPAYPYIFEWLQQDLAVSYSFTGNNSYSSQIEAFNYSTSGGQDWSDYDTIHDPAPKNTAQSRFSASAWSDFDYDYQSAVVAAWGQTTRHNAIFNNLSHPSLGWTAGTNTELANGNSGQFYIDADSNGHISASAPLNNYAKGIYKYRLEVTPTYTADLEVNENEHLNLPADIESVLTGYTTDNTLFEIKTINTAPTSADSLKVYAYVWAEPEMTLHDDTYPQTLLGGHSLGQIRPAISVNSNADSADDESLEWDTGYTGEAYADYPILPFTFPPDRYNSNYCEVSVYAEIEIHQNHTAATATVSVLPSVGDAVANPRYTEFGATGVKLPYNASSTVNRLVYLGSFTSELGIQNPRAEILRITVDSAGTGIFTIHKLFILPAANTLTTLVSDTTGSILLPKTVTYYYQKNIRFNGDSYNLTNLIGSAPSQSYPSNGLIGGEMVTHHTQLGFNSIGILHEVPINDLTTNTGTSHSKEITINERIDHVGLA